MDELAINGGSAVFSNGPPDWPPKDSAIEEALHRMAADGSWGRYHGPHCAALIDAISAYLNVEHVRLYSSGTIAVEAALRAAGVGEGDRVLLAGYDFPGNFRAIESIGARPVLVEPSSETWSFDPAAIEQARDLKPRAAIVSHLHGGLAPMLEIRKAANEYGVLIIEDACQAHGAVIGGKPAGTWGDVGVWSFGGSKLLTAGRGGAIFTADANIAQRAKLFSERGNDAFPLSEMQATVLLPQLEQLDQRTERRQKSVMTLLAQIAALNAFEPVALSDARHAFYKLALRTKRSTGGEDLRDQVAAAARAEGLALDAGFRGFARRGGRRCDRAGDLPVSRQLAAKTLVLHHPILLEDAEAIKRAALVLQKLTSLLDS